jgi:beta-lactamase class A
VVLLLSWLWWAKPRWPWEAHPAPTLVAGNPPAPLAAPLAAPAGRAASLLDVSPPVLAEARPEAALQAAVEQVIDPDNGSTAVVVRNLRTGATATYHDHDLFRSASLAKVPILIETFRQLAAGRLRPDELLTVTADSITDGAGVLQGRVGDRLTVAELLNLAVSVSDNVAARLLIQRVGGVDAVNRTMVAMGANQTRLYADDRPNTTSAADMAVLLAWIATRAPVATGAAPGAGAALGAAPVPGTLASLMALSQAQSWITDGVPASVPVAHKSGQLPGARHDAGVVYGPGGPYVVVVLSDDLDDQDAAEAFIGRVSHVVYDYFKPS